MPEGASRRVFFHINNDQRRYKGPKTLPENGETIALLAGSSPRRPSGQEAVRWFRLESGTIANQHDYDAIRRPALEVLPLNRLGKLLQADWYRSVWSGNPPPDLVDPLLDAVCQQALRCHSYADFASGKVAALLQSCCYNFAATADAAEPPLMLARYFQPRQLAMLGPPRAEWMAPASEPIRTTLIEWHLQRRHDADAHEPWAPFLMGKTEAERGAANALRLGGADADDRVNEWLARLATNGLLPKDEIAAWTEGRPATALAMYEHLSPRQRARLLDELRQDHESDDTRRAIERRLPVVLADMALGLDLESDGEITREIGVAQGGTYRLLYDRAASGNSSGIRRSPLNNEPATVARAMHQLVDLAGAAPLVCGHNILAWDWPIIRQHVPDGPDPLIWDSLLVAFLLAPSASSHALGGDHRADTDARDARDLFARQLDQFRPELARSILTGAFKDTASLFAALPPALRANQPFDRPLPAGLASQVSSGKTLLLWPSQLRALDWTSGTAIVAANPAEGLSADFRQIDPVALDAILATEALITPCTSIVAGVVRLAAEQGVAVRRNMIPAWMERHTPALASALDRASIVPASDSKAICAAAIPKQANWWLSADATRFCTTDDLGGCLLFDDSALRVAEEAIMAPPSSLRLRRVGDREGLGIWECPDPAARKLETTGRTRLFAILPLPSGLQRLPVGIGTSQGADAAHKPHLATRHRIALHPGTAAQLDYWIEVLRTFWEKTRDLIGATPVLLVGSSTSRDLVRRLEVALAEMGLGEVRPEYRSQREHLLCAAKGGRCLVVALRDFAKLNATARDAGVVLQPFVEALPLEEWLACAMSTPLPDGNSLTDDPAPPAAAREWTAAQIVQAAPELVAAHFPQWMRHSGLAEAGAPVLVLDSRLGRAGPVLSDLFALSPVNEASLSDAAMAAIRVALAPFSIVREKAPHEPEAMEAFLVEHWNKAGDGPSRVSGFKPSQQAPLAAICARDAHVLVALPTGEGKSVLFQVPALCRGLRNRRLTLVISPLKVLMRDQVEGLHELGFAESVDFLNGDLSRHEAEQVLQGVLENRIVLLYVAPERLRNAEFADVLKRRMEFDGGLENVVIDEAHCVNQWGFEFRPDYFSALNHLLRACARHDSDAPTPFLLLSATVTRFDRKALEFIMGKKPTVELVASTDKPFRPLPLVARPDAFANPIRSHITVGRRKVPRPIDSNDFAASADLRIDAIIEAVREALANRAQTGQRSAVIVFVTARWQAEDLAEILSARLGIEVDFFHAGLDAGARENAYNAFREGDTDVLVATKAFGMGMDIPDIHWAIHLSPPNYLEDYLQEVGRIGRGSAEMQRAQLGALNACLPFANSDFEKIRDQRAQSMLTPNALDEVFDHIAQSPFTVEGIKVAVVPGQGYDKVENDTARRAAQTRTRMALYWLERDGRVQLLATIPDTIALELDLDALASIAGEEAGPLGALAGLLRDIDKEVDVKPPRSSPSTMTAAAEPTGLLERLAQRLVNGIGALLSPAKTKQPPTPPTLRWSVPPSAEPAPEPSDSRALIHLSVLRFRLPTPVTSQELMSMLGDLQKLGAIRFTKKITVKKGTLRESDYADDLFAIIDGSVRALLAGLRSSSTFQFDPADLADVGFFLGKIRLNPRDDDAESPSEDLDAKAKAQLEIFRKHHQKAFINGFRSLAKASGIRLRQIIDDGGEVRWEATLPLTEQTRARGKQRAIVDGAKAVRDVVEARMGAQDSTDIEVSWLIEAVQAANLHRQFSDRDLKRTAGLLSAMKLLRMDVEIVEFAHIVAWREDIATDSTAHDELLAINDLAEVRNLAMEVFANLRPEAQDAFIAGYFAQSDAAGMRDFLETQLGEIDDTDADREESGDENRSRVILEMQEKLRATKATELFERFRASEEPAQWEAVRHPANKHLLVNAGPGAGKTFVLTGRIAHLIREQHIQPSQILVLAFNRAVVFEIRRRTRNLFQSLGYAAHASRLRISTIHGLAMRHLKQAGEDVDFKDLLRDFARKLTSDETFRRDVAGDVRCILVDEFQDFGDDEFAVLKALYDGSGQRAGIMAIGDDDQDIQRYSRPSRAFAQAFFDRFKAEIGGTDLQELVLGVNFRSARRIVQVSQHMIDAFFRNSPRSRRLKVSQLIPRAEPMVLRHFQKYADETGTLDDAIAEVRKNLPDILGHKDETTAILCTTNADVARVHAQLAEEIPSLVVQGKANLDVRALRHVALWLDSLDREMADQDRELTPALKAELVDGFITATDIPEFRSPDPDTLALQELWDSCLREKAYPRLSALVQFIRELKGDDLPRLGVAAAGASSVVLSTVHKVKGLEYDNVVVMPSDAAFPLNRDSDLAACAADEARLLYVAVTRAKVNLWWFVGRREHAWKGRVPNRLSGTRRDEKLLDGEYTEIDLSWAIRQGRFNPNPAACQDYILRYVRAGDRIELGWRDGRSLFHRNGQGERRQIGRVAESLGRGEANHDLKVSAVVRYYPIPEDEAGRASVRARPLKERPWHYAVLVTGRLR